MTDKLKLAFTIHVIDKYGSGTERFTAALCYQDSPDQWCKSGFKFPQNGAFDPAERDIAGLSILAQRHEDSEWYAMRVVCDLDEISLKQAEATVKMLRRIDKGLAKLDETFGRTDDLAAFCGRVASVLKMDAAPFAIPCEISGWGYRWADVDALRYHVEKSRN